MPGMPASIVRRAHDFLPGLLQMLACRQVSAIERIREHVLHLQKERRSFGGLTNAITNALNITSSSSNQNLPVLKRQATHASCSGNWLSHFDWDGQRRAPPFHCLCMLMELQLMHTYGARSVQCPESHAAHCPAADVDQLLQRVHKD